jgi:hypothetical protein
MGTNTSKPLDDTGIEFEVTASKKYTEYTFRIHSGAPQGKEWATLILKTWLGDTPKGGIKVQTGNEVATEK